MSDRDIKTNHEGRSRLYKCNNLNNDVLRKKRREEGIQIRKQKRIDIFDSRRKRAEPLPSIEISDAIPAELMEQLKSENLGIEANAIRHIGQKLTIGELELKDLVACGVLSVLSDIYCNRSRNDLLKNSIAEIMVLSTGCSPSGISSDIKCIESLCSVISDDDVTVAAMCDALQAISVFVGINAVYRNIAFDVPIVPSLLNVYEKNDERVNRCVMWLVSQLFHKLQEYSPEVEEVTPLLDLVANGMQSHDPTVQSDAIRTCALMAEWQCIWNEMHNHKILPLLVNSMSSGIGVARPSVLRAIDFITQTTNDFTPELIDSGLLEVLKPLINIRYLSRDVCFIVGNISVEEFVIDRLVSSGVLKEVAKVMDTAEYTTRKEAAYTICHCCSSTSRAHIAYILEIGFLGAFTDLLTCMDPSLIIYILDAIESLLLYGEINLAPDYTNPVSVQLEEIGCRQKLEFLTQSQNIDIHAKSYAILERFFDDDELVQYNSCSAEIRTNVDQTIDSILSAVVARES